MVSAVNLTRSTTRTDEPLAISMEQWLRYEDLTTVRGTISWAREARMYKEEKGVEH